MKNWRKISIFLVIANSLFIAIIAALLLRLYQIYQVRIQTKVLSESVINESNNLMESSMSLKQALSTNGQIANMREFGITFDGNAVKSKWGDEFKLAKDLESGNLIVYPTIK